MNKQTKANAEFNPNSIKNLFNLKMTFNNIFQNSIQNITNLKMCMTQAMRRCYLLKLSIDIKYVNKQTKNMYINKHTTAKA